MAAESRAGSAGWFEHGQTDMSKVLQLALGVFGSADIETHEAAVTAWDAALDFVRIPAVWEAIEEIAAILLIRGFLDQASLARLLHPTRRPLPRLPIVPWQPSLFPRVTQTLAKADVPKPPVAAGLFAPGPVVALTVAQAALLQRIQPNRSAALMPGWVKTVVAWTLVTVLHRCRVRRCVDAIPPTHAVI
jgi:hypothetical protein